MPPVGFEPTVSVGQRPQTYALDRAATGTCQVQLYSVQNSDRYFEGLTIHFQLTDEPICSTKQLTSHLLGPEPFLSSSFQVSQEIPEFYGIKSSPPSSPGLATCPYPKPDQSSPRPIPFLKDQFHYHHPIYT